MRRAEKVFSDICARLAAATTERTAFTAGYLGTVDADQHPQVRTVILRSVESDQFVVSFATARRSQKFFELSANPAAAFTLHDDMVQLRLTGHVAEDCAAATRNRIWQGFAEHTRAQFASFEDFAWLNLTVAAFDWLDLTASERWRGQRAEQGWQIRPVAGFRLPTDEGDTS